MSGECDNDRCKWPVSGHYRTPSVCKTGLRDPRNMRFYLSFSLEMTSSKSRTASTGSIRMGTCCGSSRRAKGTSFKTGELNHQRGSTGDTLKKASDRVFRHSKKTPGSSARVRVRKPSGSWSSLPKGSPLPRFFCLVPKGGFEPPRGCPHCDLNAARLPIPPLRHA